MIAGLLLAAGSGRRFGGPKALVDTGTGPWVLRTLDTLAATDRRVVVVGAAAEDVAALLPPGVTVVHNAEHQAGMGSSLRAGLAALAPDGADHADRIAAADDVDAALVMLVDLPDVPAAAIERVLGAAGSDPRAALARASYRGTPGHPVLIGRNHFAGVIAAAVGDRGARDYLAAAEVRWVDCSDLATGTDRDEPAQEAGPGSR
jgi:CTP:molybdopterin cytidylyltransferase MocA